MDRNEKAKVDELIKSNFDLNLVESIAILLAVSLAPTHYNPLKASLDKKQDLTLIAFDYAYDVAGEILRRRGQL